MQTHLTPLQKVEAVERGIALLTETKDPALGFVADALAIWVCADGANLRLDDALGLPSHWRSSVRKSRRNQLLCSLAATHWPQLRGWPLVRAVSGALLRYETTAFARHKRSDRPDGLAGDLYDLLIIGDVPQAEQLRNILS